jgi:hypothetical protein
VDAGIEPVTSRWKTSTYAAKPRGLVDILRKKIILQSSHNYFQMLHYGRRTHNNRAVFFMGSRGLLWVQL